MLEGNEIGADTGSITAVTVHNHNSNRANYSRERNLTRSVETSFDSRCKRQQVGTAYDGRGDVRNLTSHWLESSPTYKLLGDH
jgi:hypothetical protein